MATTEVRPGHAELGLSGDDLLGMYRAMLLARAVDERMWLMQRAGKIAFIISGQGHEGAQVGMTWPMRRGVDWMAPYYRSIASAMTFGMSAEDIITAHLAKGDDVSSGGRQMPGHYGGAPYNIVSLSSPVGTQVLHAVGIAMGAWVRGDDVVAMTSFGEGTANQGEIHEAMNFASVHRLPVIFVCENNGYAISVPLDRQVGGGSVAARAAGYGMPGIDVDGNDPIACYAAAKGAHDRARRGEGPTLIEAHVVRLTSHSSDDDQRRYRDPAEVEALKERDPIPAFASELRAVGALDDALDEVFGAYSVDPRRVAVGGFSDGASYALSLGLINGELFSHVFAFAPGFMAPERLQGKPRIFISHGIADRVLAIDSTSRRIVPQLKRAGYAVDYEEFAGGHEVPDGIARRFLGTLAGEPLR